MLQFPDGLRRVVKVCIWTRHALSLRCINQRRSTGRLEPWQYPQYRPSKDPQAAGRARQADQRGSGWWTHAQYTQGGGAPAVRRPQPSHYQGRWCVLQPSVACAQVECRRPNIRSAMRGCVDRCRHSRRMVSRRWWMRCRQVQGGEAAGGENNRVCWSRRMSPPATPFKCTHQSRKKEQEQGAHQRRSCQHWWRKDSHLCSRSACWLNARRYCTGKVMCRVATHLGCTCGKGRGGRGPLRETGQALEVGRTQSCVWDPGVVPGCKGREVNGVTA